METNSGSGTGVELETDIVLGWKYRDKLHGIIGIATSRAEYLTGCAQVRVEFLKEGEIKNYWFDETQLEPVEGVNEKAADVTTPAGEKPGGPRPVAPSRDPS